MSNHPNLLRALLCCVPLLALAADDADLDRLIVGPPVLLGQLQRSAERMAEADRATYLAVGLEIGSEPAERVRLLAPLIEGRREVVATMPWLATSLADAAAGVGAADRADAALALLPAEPSALDRADLASVRARIALARDRLGEAGDAVKAARAALAKAVPEAAYASWRSRLIARRIELIAHDVEAATMLAAAGPACWAWIQADRARSDAAYAAVASEHADTLFAQAAQLERARLRFAAGDGRECARLIAQDPRLRDGPLAAAAALLAGDAALQAGEPREAKAAYEAALAALAKPAPLPPAVAAGARQAITPPQPLHDLAGWSYPTWRRRPAGAVLAADLDRHVASWLRYQAVIRLSAVVALSGDRPAAATLARSLVSFDEVDREMQRDQRGPGGSLLAHLYETGDAVVPIAALHDAPPDAAAKLMLAIAFYQVYDWDQAAAWLGAALRGPLPPGVRDGATALHACATQMCGDYAAALAEARAVRLAAGAPATLAWVRARQVEFQILQSTPEDPEGAMAALQQIVERADGSAFGEEALLWEATYAMGHDLDLARRLFLALRKRYPKAYPQTVAMFLDQIGRQLTPGDF